MKCCNDSGARHVLREHKGSVPAYNGSAQCDECGQSGLDRYELFHRCNNCEYDRCTICSLIKLTIIDPSHIMIPESDNMWEIVPNHDQNNPNKKCTYCEKSNQEVQYFIHGNDICCLECYLKKVFIFY
jgi:hypothetical protein